MSKLKKIGLGLAAFFGTALLGAGLVLFILHVLSQFQWDKMAAEGLSAIEAVSAAWEAGK